VKLVQINGTHGLGLFATSTFVMNKLILGVERKAAESNFDTK